MSLLQQVAPTDATGTVGEIYQQAEQMMGFIPNALQLYSVNPITMQQLWGFIGYVSQHPSLSGKLFAVIRVMVSVEDHCEYCIGLNESMLINMHDMTVEQVAAMKADPQNATLDEKETALLLYALKALADSNGVGKAEVQALHDKGCSDLEIHDALAQATKQQATNIMLNAFKVEHD